jgi:pimeloyl-ACP methyl ester carboxylesterase
LRVICVNRPGCGNTTPALDSSAEAHVSAACHDIVAVLDGFGIKKTELLFMCAGAPFALAFVANHRDRIVEDKPILGIAAFVPPADCDQTKLLFRFGARYSPVSVVSWLLGGIFDSVFGNMLGYLSQEKAVHEITKNLSPKELVVLKQQYGSDDADFGENFYKELMWMVSEGGGKNTSSDLKTVLTTYQEYIKSLHQQQPHPQISLFHGQQDKLTCIEAADWLANALPYTKLTSLEGGTHEGTLFMLHPELAKILNTLS